MKKQLCVVSLVLVVALALTLGPVFAAEARYSEVELPSTIRVIVAYSAGGSTDTLVRVTIPYFEDALEELTGRDVSAVAVNLPGAGGEIGWTRLANAEPDGSTIGIINLPAVPIVERARDVAYEPWLDGFTPLGLNVIDPNIVRVGDRSRFSTLAEAIEAAQENPGSVIVGADGPLSDDHLAVYALAQATGATFTFIPYDGGAPANRAQRTGEIDLAMGNVFDYVQTEDATVDAAILSAERYPLVEEVPTVEETLGIDVGELGSTRGFAGPAGMPEDVVTVYREAFRLTFNNVEYQEAAKERAVTIVRPRVGEEFGAVMEANEELVDELIQYFIEEGYVEE